MVDLSFTRNHVGTLSLPYLCLEIYADQVLPKDQLDEMSQLIQKAWPLFQFVAEKQKLYEHLELNLKGKVLEVELVWTDNPTMRQLNEQYRQKEGPTDVLTFTLLADAPDPSLWMSLPVLQLGSIFVSVDYARDAIRETPDVPLEQYLLERFLHGMLHLLGMHHDTMEKYDRVVAIQKEVLALTFPALNQS